MREVTGARGDRVILHCQVDSNPAPEYRWLKNGDMFEVSDGEPELIKNCNHIMMKDARI